VEDIRSSDEDEVGASGKAQTVGGDADGDAIPPVVTVSAAKKHG